MALTRTRLSVVTWKDPEADAVVAWGQVSAYLPEIRRIIDHHGPSIVYLPHARLTKQQLGKASGELGAIGSQEGRPHVKVRREAEASVREGLADHGELARFEKTITAQPSNRP